jgi:hypothetical protein
MSNIRKAKEPRSCYGCRALYAGPQLHGGYKCQLGYAIVLGGIPKPFDGRCAKPITVTALCDLLIEKSKTNKPPQAPIAKVTCR